MPRTDEQNEAIREATRAKLVASAMLLFAENGYASTSIRMIAKHADVSTGLLYHYFASKEELMTAVFENCMAIITEGIDAAQTVNSPLAKITGIVRFVADAIQGDPLFWGLFQSWRTQPAVMDVVGDGLRYATNHLRDLFAGLLAEAEHEEPETGAYVLYCLIEGMIQQYLLEPDSYPIEVVVEQIIGQFGK